MSNGGSFEQEGDDTALQ